MPLFRSLFVFVFAATVGSAAIVPRAQACDMCACAFNPKKAKANKPSGAFITTPTGTTMGQGSASVGFLFEHQRYNKIPAGDAHTLHHQGYDVHGKNHEEAYQFSLGYGVTDDWDVYLLAPIVSRSSTQIHSHRALGADERADGLGDARLVGKVRVWDQAADIALILGVKAPTGETSDKDGTGGKFEPELQPGSGSWDIQTGFAASKGLSDHVSASGGFQYSYRGEGGQAFDAGDVFRLDGGISYALKPLGECPNASLVLELHNQWALRDRNRAGDKVEDSGGTTILLSPGVSADLTPSVTAFFSVPFPVYQNLGGQHEELKYEAIAGFSLHF
jgi:Putative MetA-pathway of phenol degradation